MARVRSAEHARGKSKTTIAAEELTRGIDKFQELLAQVEDLSREGFPYRDAVRARAELQIRDAIRRVFGERSPESQSFKSHRLRIGSPADTAQSLAFLKSLITSLENRKLELLGIKPSTPPLSDEQTTHAQQAQSRPQLSLVSPHGTPAQVTITPVAGTATPVAPPPVTMSVALTTNLGTPSAPPLSSASQPSATAQPPGSAPSAAAPSLAQTEPSPLQHQSAPSIAPAELPPPKSGASTGFASVSKPTMPQPAQEHPKPIQPLSPSTASAPTPASPEATPSSGASAGAVPPTQTSIPPARSEKEHSGEPLPFEDALSSPLPLQPQTEASTLRNQNARPETDPLDRVRKLCSRFHAVARQLRLRREYRTTLEVEDEYDVQDLLHALLRLEFDEVEIEEWIPGYTQGSPRTTFLLPKNGIAVVVKKTRTGLGGREVAEQLQIDSDRYAARKHCNTLLCFVYDPEGRIGNPRGFESDLTRIGDSYTVELLISPK